MPPCLVVLEDDPDCRNLLHHGLRGEYDVVFVNSGAELLARLDSDTVDLVVLDIRLPHEDGFSIARQIRRVSEVPVVFLSGLDAEDAVVKGLDIGGDDYVTKPFSTSVLAARIRNLLRREPKPPNPSPRINEYGEYRLDPLGKLLVHPDGRTARLTEMEVRILDMLMQATGVPVSRDELYRRIHGRGWDRMSREIDVHISNLRRKLQAEFEINDAVQHIRGIGYRLNPTAFERGV